MPRRSMRLPADSSPPRSCSTMAMRVGWARAWKKSALKRRSASCITVTKYILNFEYTIVPLGRCFSQWWGVNYFALKRFNPDILYNQIAIEGAIWDFPSSKDWLDVYRLRYSLPHCLRVGRQHCSARA